MKIICLKGGLGNQLFEYCRYRQLLEAKEGKVYMFRDFRKLKQHNHLLISQCFDIELPPQYLMVTILTLAIKTLRILHLWSSLYDDTSRHCVLIDDYSQEKRYIKNALQLFKFRKFTLTPLTTHYLSLINEAQYPVAIHVRRGDYLLADNPSNIGVCDISYYQKAIETIRKQHTDAHYFFFSDDIEWVRNHFSDDNATFIKKEETEPDYVDLYLMTKCKAHIIANSTFSFWGSLLTDHEKHLCIYPKRWFANPEWTVPDIFPSHWIAL